MIDLADDDLEEEEGVIVRLTGDEVFEEEEGVIKDLEEEEQGVRVRFGFSTRWTIISAPCFDF